MEREQLSWQERGQLWLRLIIRLVLAAAAVVLVAKLGPPLLSLFAPFVAALIVAALLNPAVRWLQRRLGWSRKLLSLLLVVVIFGVIGGCLGILTYAAANELFQFGKRERKQCFGQAISEVARHVAAALGIRYKTRTI